MFKYHDWLTTNEMVKTRVYRIGIESIRPNTNSSTNKQIRSFAYFNVQHAVLMLKLLYAQMI